MVKNIFFSLGLHVRMLMPAGPGGLDPPPPLLCHDVGFLTLGPKLDPRLAPPPFLLVDLICPLSKILIRPWHIFSALNTIRPGLCLLRPNEPLGGATDASRK